MTPEEVIEILEKKKEYSERIIDNFLSHSRGEIKDANETIEMCDMAISALKEIQQYREIGTVEELKNVGIVLIKRNKTLERMIDECMEYEKIGTVEECREAVEKLKRAEEALNVILSGNYNDECSFCVHNDNPIANCQCICGDGSWCIHNAKWNGKTSEDENLEGMEDE